MTWREQLICRILLIIARLVTDDPAIAQDLKHLSSHISVEGKKNQPSAGEETPCS